MAEAEVERLRRRAAELEAEVARLREAAEVADAREEHRRAIFESAVDFAIVVMDRDGRITDWNAGAQRIFGWPVEEVRGERADRLFTPEDQAAGRVADEMRGALEIGRASDERWHLRRDGARFWASGEMMPLRGRDGAHLGFLKILRDRTERRRFEAELRESEARFRSTFDQAAVGVAHVGLEGRWLRVNARLCAMLGYTEAELLERSFQDVTHPDDLETDLANLRSLLAGEIATYGLEKRYIRKDDSLLWINLTVAMLRDDEGVPQHFISIIEDISARKAAERALRASEERLRIAQRAGGVGTFEWYPETGSVDASDEYRAIFGLAPGAEVTEALLVSLVHPDDRGLAGPARLRTGGNPLDYAEYRITRPDTGEERTIARRGVVLPGSDGGAQRFVGAAFDVTERKRAEQALRNLNETLEQRIEAEVAERARTEEALRQSQKMEAVGQLTGGLAHDFNNLLTGITGSLELLSTRIRQGRLGEVDRYVVAAQGAANRAAGLTHRLLAFSRRQTLDPKPVNINRLIAGMEELIRRTVGPAIQVEVVGAAGLWTTLVDPNQLENALLNLCLNARDAMPEGGRLTIETANKWLDGRTGRERDLLPGQYLSLCVTDTGNGMTPEVVSRAFDPFFTTKPIGAGTGLGLSMVYGFTKQSGGQVRIYSEIGRGTTMCLYLPRFHGQEGDAEAAADPVATARERQGRTVLVVDDEPTVRMLVTEVLEELGCTVIEAEDGAAGLRALQSDARIDLLVTDVGLPGGMNGRQVADAGRALRPGLRVLFITGYAENAAVGNGHLEPGMHLLTKPFAMDVLAGRVKDLLATG